MSWTEADQQRLREATRMPNALTRTDLEEQAWCYPPLPCPYKRPRRASEPERYITFHELRYHPEKIWES